MNAYLKKILLIVGIFSVIFLSGFENKTSAEESCTFVPDDFVWSGDNLKDESPTIRDKIYVLTINTSNCKNTPFTLDLNNDDNTFNETVAIKIKNEIKSALTFTAEEDKITLTFKTHEQSCDAHLGPDCQVFLRINQGNILSTKETLKGYHTNNLWITDKSYLEKGVLFANCRDDGLLAAGAVIMGPLGMILNEGFDVKIGCSDTQWELLKAVGGTIEGFEDFATPIEPINQQFDPESPCFISQEEGYDPNCYELLAPVPGLKGATDPLGNNRWSINLKNFQIGDYVNSLFSIALGILTLLAVIMIVIAGVQYMTIESFQGKSDAKSRITGALTGLLLALSIYIVLGTINPDLLQVNFGSNIEEVALSGIYDDGGFEYQSSGETNNIYQPIGKARQNCPEFVTINQPLAISTKSFRVCVTIKDAVEQMLSKAKQDGIILTAFGARSAERQIELRKKNCGLGEYNIYKKRSGLCKPPTAIPGTSLHESGFALDIQCVRGGKEGAVNVHSGNKNGTKKEWTRDCWNWLNKNAKNFGFVGIKSENWHWNYK